MTSPYTTDDPDTEQPDTECVWCGSYIPAGKYPPVCCLNCQFEIELAVEFERWARNQAKDLIK